MKKDKLTRSFYIILVPVILVVILINSGVLQARIPAVSVEGQGIRVAQFNYYYFTAYNEFVAEQFDESGKGPFDQNTALRDQVKEDGVTWKDYFLEQAQDRLAEVVYYSELAGQADYAFSQEELQPVQDQLEKLEQDCVDSGISKENYLVAYWGVGMTEEVYTAELTRSVQADAYRAHLTAETPVGGEEIAAWIQEHQPESYAAANLRMIVLKAAGDRFTGAVGEQQIQDLTEKLGRLQARCEENGESFGALAAAFCDDADLAESGGVLLDAVKADLPDAVAEWVFDPERQAGDTVSLVDGDSAYLVILDGWGTDAAQLTAIRALQAQKIAQAWEQADVRAGISHNALGWRLVGR